MAKSTRDLTSIESFLCGGAAGVGAATVVHPLDVLRVRQQLDAEGGGLRMYNGPIHCATSIVKADGFTGLYAGFTAGIARQIGIALALLSSFFIIRFPQPTECLVWDSTQSD